ncbi:MAG: hypothetical protein JJP05_07395 [cyanobacterium endosymbiont of Rhopalodia gibba]|jgi:hypothetical protein
MTVSSIPTQKFISILYNNIVINIPLIGVIAKRLCMATEPTTDCVYAKLTVHRG